MIDGHLELFIDLIRLFFCPSPDDLLEVDGDVFGIGPLDFHLSVSVPKLKFGGEGGGNLSRLFIGKLIVAKEDVAVELPIDVQLPGLGVVEKDAGADNQDQK